MRYVIVLFICSLFFSCGKGKGPQDETVFNDFKTKGKYKQGEGCNGFYYSLKDFKIIDRISKDDKVVIQLTTIGFAQNKSGTKSREYNIEAEIIYKKFGDGWSFSEIIDKNDPCAWTKEFFSH
jgi:hypothetical protein